MPQISPVRTKNRRKRQLASRPAPHPEVGLLGNSFEPVYSRLCPLTLPSPGLLGSNPPNTLIALSLWDTRISIHYAIHGREADRRVDPFFLTQSSPCP